MERQSPYDHNKVRQTIESQGRIKQWVADQLGINQSHLSHLIHGSRPITDRNAQKLAEILNVPVESFHKDHERVGA